MIQRITFAFVICLAFCSPLWAAEITIGSFLASTRYDELLDQADEKLAFLHTTSPNTPYLDKLEFRTATDEFRATDQKYRLRVYPNGWGETAAGEELFDTTLALAEAQRDMVSHQALTRRYLLVVDYLHAKADLDLHRNLELLQQDRCTVLKKNIDSIDFDVNDLIEGEDDLLRLQMDLPEMENNLFTLAATIRQYAGVKEEIVFNTETLIGISDLDEKIRQLAGDFGNGEDNIYLRSRWLQVEEERWRYELEKSQSRRYVSFFEASYDNKDREHAREAYSLEFGIELPLVNSRRLDITQGKLDYLTEQGRYEEAKQSIEQEVERLNNELSRLISHYDRIAAGSNTGPRYRHAEGTDPLVLLKIRENRVRRDSALNDLRHQIYRRYVELLDVTGTLSQTPVKNYLSKEQEDIGL